MLRAPNEIRNQRLPNNKNSSFARRTQARRCLFQKVVGAAGGSEQNHCTAQNSGHRRRWRVRPLRLPEAPTQVLWGTFLMVTKGPGATLPGPPPKEDHLTSCHSDHHRNQPSLTRQGQGVVPPTGCRHNHLVAETLNEPGGFHSLGVAVSKLPLLVATCRARAR